MTGAERDLKSEADDEVCCYICYDDKYKNDQKRFFTI